MNEEIDMPQLRLWRRLPARLSRHEVAQELNFKDDDSISALVAAKMLKPLGEPPEGAPLWFASCEITRVKDNVKWLHKATKVVRLALNKKVAKRKITQNGLD